MRIALSVFLIFLGVVSFMTGVGAFAGVLFIAAGIAVWVWGVVGSQTDETIAKFEGDNGKKSTIIDPNDPNNHP